MISLLLLILPTILAASGTKEDFAPPNPEDLELLSDRTCDQSIQHYFPHPDPHLLGLAKTETRRILADRNFSCIKKYNYEYNRSVKMVCKRLYNSQNASSTNGKLCEMFLTDKTPRRVYNVHRKLTVKNFDKYGCAFTYDNGASAIVCAFQR